MKPKGFWSYARGDDDHLGKMLSDLRREIAGEVSMLMGEDVGIFQDIHDLRTGDRWEEKLRDGVSNASFLIPVLTPLFFNRPWCREEVLTYLRINAEAGLEPRIFPIRLVEWDEDEACEVRQALQRFQYKDFAHWRYESDPTQRARMLNDFAKDVKARLQLPPAAPKPAKVAAAPALQTEPSTQEINLPRKEETPPPKQTVHVVDSWPKRGDFTSIQAAIDAAENGDRIVVREGTYREALRLSKVLEIIGEGDRERIVVTTDKGNALHCDAPMARIAGLLFRREVGDAYGCAVWIDSGGAEIEDCVMESLSAACVVIKGSSTTPTLRRCLLRDGKDVGLYVMDGAQPVGEDCQFIGNDGAGVITQGRATRITLRRCLATYGKSGGFCFSDTACGILDGCEAIGNGNSGVIIWTGADPVVRNCTLRDNGASGLTVEKSGRGRIEGGRITGNGLVGVTVDEGSSIVATGCTITANTYEGVWIIDAESTGTFRNNDLRGNERGAWDIAEGAKVERHGNIE